MKSIKLAILAFIIAVSGCSLEQDIAEDDDFSDWVSEYPLMFETWPQLLRIPRVPYAELPDDTVTVSSGECTKFRTCGEYRGSRRHGFVYTGSFIELLPPKDSAVVEINVTRQSIFKKRHVKCQLVRAHYNEESSSYEPYLGILLSSRYEPVSNSPGSGIAMGFLMPHKFRLNSTEGLLVDLDPEITKKSIRVKDPIVEAKAIADGWSYSDPVKTYSYGETPHPKDKYGMFCVRTLPLYDSYKADMQVEMTVVDVDDWTELPLAEN